MKSQEESWKKEREALKEENNQLEMIKTEEQSKTEELLAKLSTVSKEFEKFQAEYKILEQ